MAIQKQRSPRLGKGLSALMARPVPMEDASVLAGTSRASSSTGAVSNAVTTPGVAGVHPGAQMQGEIAQIPLDDIQPNPHQPRKNFERGALGELAESIRVNGLMQPIIVKPAEAGQVPSFILVAGERRWHAARLAELPVIPAIVRQLDEDQSAKWALIENLQREDLNPIERASGFEHLINQFGLTHEQVAKWVGSDRSTITNSLRLLYLHPDIQSLIAQSVLSAGQAKVLAGVDDEIQQLQLAKLAIREEWSVRKLEAAARTISRTVDGEKKVSGEFAAMGKKSAHLADLEQQVAEQLGTKVKIKPGRKKGTGKLSIDFYSFEQFETLLGKLGVQPQG